MTGLADREIEITLRNRVVFGVGALRRLPELVAAAGGSRVFLVTDPGVVVAGLATDVSDGLSTARLPFVMFSEVEPNPSGATVEFGAMTLRSFGLDGTVVVALGGGSAMDAAKGIALRAANDIPVGDRVRRADARNRPPHRRRADHGRDGLRGTPVRRHHA